MAAKFDAAVGQHFLYIQMTLIILGEAMLGKKDQYM